MTDCENDPLYKRVKPINHIMDRKMVYDFDSVAIDDIPDDVNVSGVEIDYVNGVEDDVDIKDFDGVVRYQYRDREAVFITEDGVFSSVNAREREAEKQCYFALSILDEYGVVSRFRRKK